MLARHLALATVVVTCQKIMSDLDITEHGLPENGRIESQRFSNTCNIDLRDSVVPSRHGESLVMYLLHNRRSSLPGRLIPPEDCVRHRVIWTARSVPPNTSSDALVVGTRFANTWESLASYLSWRTDVDVHEQPRSRAFKILYVAHDRRIPPFEFRWLREPVVVAGDWDQVLFGAPERYCDMLLLDFSGCDGPFVERVLRRAAGHSYRVLGLIPPEAMDEALGVLGSSPHENLNIFCVTPQVRSHLSSLVEHGLLLSVKRSISQATSERRYQQLTDERSEIKRLQHLANKDPLTGASNRRALESDFARWQFAGTRPEDIGLILVDLDHLKQINDVLGHEAGDRALRGVVTGMRRNVRRADLIYRIGGDEFVLLMPHMSKTEFRRLLLRMMTWLETIPMGGGDRLGVIPRLSFGSAHGSELDATTLDELLRLADRRLYERRACVRRASGAASSPTPFSWSRSA